MISPKVRHVLLACASGVLLPLCFPKFDLWWLAWVALVPLHCALPQVGISRAFLIGWLAGTIAFTGIMSWVVTAMHLYGHVPLPISYAVMLLLTVYLGLYVGVYAGGVVWLAKTFPRFGILAAPCLWVTLELFRTYFLSGLPWMLLGYSQYRALPVIQIADITGVYGISFLIVLVNVALTDAHRWLLERNNAPLRLPFPRLSTGAAATAFGATLAYGLVALSDDGSSARRLNIGLVQPNIDQGQKWDVAHRDETMQRLKRLTDQFGRTADLILWPEAATPFIVEREPVYFLELAAMAHQADAPLLFGSPALRYHADRRPYLLNSAYLLAPDGEMLGRYDKQHLVPFGEYIPLHSSVLFFLDKLVEGIGDFEAGPGATILSFTKRAAPGEDETGSPSVKFGVVICYEVIFPNLVREFAANGAEFLATITNDAWFGPSSAPYQHFAMVVFRAVENRLAFARAANTGVSGLIDPFGRILDAGSIFTEQVLQGTIPVGKSRTFYSRFGDVFAYGCVIITAFLGLSGYVSDMKRPARGNPVALPV